MTALATGSTAALGGSPRALVIDVSWNSGFIPCEAVLFVCTTAGRALSDSYVLSDGRVRTPGGEVFRRTHPADHPQRAQFPIDLAALPQEAGLLDVVLTARAGDLEHVSDVEVLLWDPTTGSDLAGYRPGPAAPARSTLLVQVFRARRGWQVRALGSHYDRDLAAVAQERGVIL